VLVALSDGGITTYTENLPGVLNERWSPDSREFGFLTFVGATNQVELNRCPVNHAVPDWTTVGETLRRTTLLRFD
jgi:hypothetical protein